jgi:hypothetical integral membrane protein (TIGR02206 family)
LRFLDTEHLAGVAVVLTLTGAVTLAARRWPGPWITGVSRVLALLIVLTEPSYWAQQIINHTWSARYDLPLQLSNASEFVSAAALWWRTPFLVELTYFWGFGAVLQALATPDFPEHFPDPAYFRFYVTHGGILLAAVFLTVGLRITPRPGTTVRVFFATIAYTAFVGVVDVLTGGNYMYLRQKPAAGSLLNFMGPWPWYIGAGLILAVIVLTILNAPFWLARRCRDLDGFAFPRYAFPLTRRRT